MWARLSSCASATLSPLLRNCHVIQIATLTSRTTRGGPLKLKKPFPYEKRKINEFEAMWDVTVKRIEEENAKLIVVDGPIAVGKSAVGKALAEEFDMKFIPEPTLDEIYITETGYDLRQLDDQLHEECRTYDHKNFNMCPNHKSASSYQLRMLRLRYSKYIDALAHILNTGQGIVMERSFFSDVAFAKAMLLENYIGEQVYDFYYKLREICTPLLMRPHVVIYLDSSVSVVQQRIKTRNYSYEVNSKALTPSYLQNLEDIWKNMYLKEADKDSTVLVYDWSQGGDVDLIIEDLEELDLDPLSKNWTGKYIDWKCWRLGWRSRRLMYTNKKDHLMDIITPFFYDIPALLVEAEYINHRQKLYDAAPGYLHGKEKSLLETLFSIEIPWRKNNKLRV